MSTDYVLALSDLDDAIASVEAARDTVGGNTRLTGNPNEPGAEGFFGPVFHELRVLRGRVADPVNQD